MRKKWNQASRIVVAVTAIVAVFTFAVSYAESVGEAKGIILLIGDGMGINQVRAAAIYSQEVLGKPLAIDSIPIRGTTTTYSADSQVTDSAAAATALYSGHKTRNGAINVLPDGTQLSTIAHAAKKAGLSVGVVSTTRLTHATPAAVYSQSPRRDDEDLIAQQLPEFQLDVALAGGLSYFIPKDRPGSKRKDSEDLVELMRGAGYAYVTNGTELKALDITATPRLLGLFSHSHMAFEIDRQNVPDLRDQSRLAEMTEAALSILGRNPRGFFAVIEGGRIDHACHLHDIKASIYDTLAFDDAVKVALEYQKSHPRVLVLVTADHEPGGMGLGKGTEYALDVASLKPIKNSLDFLGKAIHKQSHDLEAILKAGGFDLDESELELLSRYPPDTRAHEVAELHGYKGTINKYVYSWIHYALSLIESDRSRIGWTSFAHTAQPVITYAVGPGEREFVGSYDNTDIAKRMAKLLGLTLETPAAKGQSTP